MEVLAGMVRAFGIALAPETPYPLPRLVRLALRLLYGLRGLRRMVGAWA